MLLRESKNKSRRIYFNPRKGFNKCERLLQRCTEIGLNHGQYIIICLLKKYYAVSIERYGNNKFIIVCEDCVCYTNKRGYFYFDSNPIIKLNSDDSIPYEINKLNKSSSGFLEKIYEDIIEIDNNIRGFAYSESKGEYYEISEKRYFELYVATLCRLFYKAEFARNDIDIISKYFPYHKEEIASCFSKKHIIAINPFKHLIRTERGTIANYCLEKHNQLYFETRDFNKERSKVLQKIRKYNSTHPEFEIISPTRYKNIKNQYIETCILNKLSYRFNHCDEYYLFRVSKLYEKEETTRNIKKHIKLKIEECKNNNGDFIAFEDILLDMGVE